MSIEEFKQTIDYRDICYFIKHVPYVSTRLDILRQLGYKVVPKKHINDPKYIISSVHLLKNKLWVQVSGKEQNLLWFVKI